MGQYRQYESISYMYSMSKNNNTGKVQKNDMTKKEKKKRKMYACTV